MPGLDESSLNVTRALLDLGYAFATASFRKNGYAVEQAGDKPLYTGLSVNRFGHCNFAPAEVLAAVALLVQRSDAR